MSGEVIMIAAVAKNGVIGNKTKIPWYIPEDFKHFKKTTLGWPCLMGEVTYYSLPKAFRPLPDRENVVCTLNKDFSEEGVCVRHDLFDAIEEYKEKYDKVFITGGATIYKLAMPKADKLIITEVDKEPEGDAFFPDITSEEWEEVDRESHEGYAFVTYKRK